MTLHGFPTARTLAGTSLVTMLPAPIVVSSPMLTPGQMIAPAPIHTLFPILIGEAISRPALLSSGSSWGKVRSTARDGDPDAGLADGKVEAGHEPLPDVLDGYGRQQQAYYLGGRPQAVAAEQPGQVGGTPEEAPCDQHANQ